MLSLRPALPGLRSLVSLFLVSTRAARSFVVRMRWQAATFVDRREGLLFSPVTLLNASPRAGSGGIGSVLGTYDMMFGMRDAHQSHFVECFAIGGSGHGGDAGSPAKPVARWGPFAEPVCSVAYDAEWQLMAGDAANVAVDAWPSRGSEVLESRAGLLVARRGCQLAWLQSADSP